jgi:hypothetical protein
VARRAYKKTALAMLCSIGDETCRGSEAIISLALNQNQIQINDYTYKRHRMVTTGATVELRKGTGW